ncbi:hypothetical protein [Noviherbaspirillum galbum]|uniref:Uncharacterized protein n=1 Tax=Noviherbaspirillum galbum TaxID=2709383 RepID=A0A6B3SRK7_9BURK|nr:hypothetical protein [Noviherbaspirillum galbum]NEX63407.1 hypothetical protein [Noviherbaspirillum galbum]
MFKFLQRVFSSTDAGNVQDDANVIGQDEKFFTVIFQDKSEGVSANGLPLHGGIDDLGATAGLGGLGFGASHGSLFDQGFTFNNDL